jgi:hypothetical protein
MDLARKKKRFLPSDNRRHHWQNVPDLGATHEDEFEAVGGGSSSQKLSIVYSIAFL